MIVYLDANVYIAAKYIFDKEKFGTLRTWVSEGKITVLYTNATVGEVTQHLKEDITQGIQSYNRVLRKYLPALKDEDTYKLSEISVEEAVEYVKENFNDFLSLDGVKLISLNPLDAEKLLNDYFNNVAPFEKKKPNEFKDAIIVNAIKKYQESCGEQICVVSSDEGFREAFAEGDRFITFEYLGKFLSYYQKKQEEFTAIENCISEAIENHRFNEVLKRYFDDCDIDRASYAEWECDDKEINEIVCYLSYIEEDSGQIYALIEVEMSLTAVITYRDEDTSYYDKEEQRYLIENFITAIEKHHITLDVRMLCSIDENEEGQPILSDCEVAKDKHMHTIDLDDDTMYDYDILSTDQHEEPNLLYCCECGQVLGRSQDGAYVNYDGSPLCTHCAKSDSKGEICPICGRKVPHEYMRSGFCKDCEARAD